MVVVNREKSFELWDLFSLAPTARNVASLLFQFHVQILWQWSEGRTSFNCKVTVVYA